MRWSEALAKHRAALEAARRPGIAMELRPIAERSFRLGASRVGGRPDLPAQVAWPTATRDQHVLPLAFVAQIRLEEVAPRDRERRLPRSGLLSFFVLDLVRISDAVGWWPDEMQRTDRLRVLHTPAGARLGRRAPPAELPADAVLPTLRPEFRRVQTWPRGEGSVPLGLDEAADAAWSEDAPENPRDQLLGHPTGCELPIGDDASAQLLLSLEAPRGHFSGFGRNGFLFVGISARDLAERRWERAFHKEW